MSRQTSPLVDSQHIIAGGVRGRHLGEPIVRPTGAIAPVVAEMQIVRLTIRWRSRAKLRLRTVRLDMREYDLNYGFAADC